MSHRLRALVYVAFGCTERSARLFVTDADPGRDCPTTMRQVHKLGRVAKNAPRFSTPLGRFGLLTFSQSNATAILVDKLDAGSF
jgi:hypothetical protein